MDRFSPQIIRTPGRANSPKFHYGYVIVFCCCLTKSINIGLVMSCAGVTVETALLVRTAFASKDYARIFCNISIALAAGGTLMAGGWDKKDLLLIIIVISLFFSCSNAKSKPVIDNKYNNMKKVLVIGASGSLAKYVIDTLQNVPGVHLTLLARNRKNIANDTTNCTIVEADVMDYNKLKNAITGQNIVYINLAGDLEAMTKNIVKAMQETGVKRVVAISSIGVYITPLKPVLIPYRKLADVIESSELDFTILRPGWFTNGNEVDYAITKKGTPETGSAISRKSIAAFVATIVKNPELHKNENLGISKPD